MLASVPVTPVNHFLAAQKQVADFRIPVNGSTARVITAVDGQSIATQKHLPAHIQHGEVTADIEHDVLKITVVNRYKNTPPAVALIHNFGLKCGAIASSVAHDSHNIVAVGTTDEELCAAVNAVIDAKGGIAVVENTTVQVLTLPVAGLMSDADGYIVAKQYAQMDAWAKRLGSQLLAPFMTLSFMALLVIPDLKLSDRALFSGKDFQFVSLWVD